MPSGFELTQEHYQALDANDQAIKVMEEYARSKAQKEAEYDVALAKRITQLRASGEAASLCIKLAKGSSEVAMKKVAWDCEEGLWEASKERVQLSKRRADAIRDQIAREWTAAGGRA